MVPLLKFSKTYEGHSRLPFENQRFLDASRLVFAYSEGKSKNIWLCSTTVTKGFWMLRAWYLHTLREKARIFGRARRPLEAVEGDDNEKKRGEER